MAPRHGVRDGEFVKDSATLQRMSRAYAVALVAPLICRLYNPSRATTIQAEGRDVVLLGDSAGKLSLISYGTNEGLSKPIVRNLGVVR